MKIGSIKENLKTEQRIAVTPEIIKKYKSLNLNIILPKGYGEHLGISDNEFINEGAEILDNDEKVLSEADLVLQMNLVDFSYKSLNHTISCAFLATWEMKPNALFFYIST